jgi:hypothetical protein
MLAGRAADRKRLLGVGAPPVGHRMEIGGGGTVSRFNRTDRFTVSPFHARNPRPLPPSVVRACPNHPRNHVALEERIMTVQFLLAEPGRVDEPQAAQDFADVLSQVAAEGKPLIVRRNGEDLAAVIPLEYLELLREIVARQEVERLAAQIDWDRMPKTRRPPQEWFDDTDNPFESEEGPKP